MTDPIVRVYETEQQARDAASRLRDEGFAADDVALVTPVSGEEAGSPAAILNALKAGQVLGAEARRYTQYLEAGRSLAAIRAPFGYARLAGAILDGFGPLEIEPRPPQRSSTAWDEAAPLSSALQLRTIQRDQPAPFSSLLGLNTLSRGGRTSLSSLLGELTNPDFAVFGRSALSHEAAPLSSLFGLQTLRASDGPWTSSFGLPLLSGNPAPLSAKLGLEVQTGGPLREHPAPLSAVLGLPALCRGRSILSRLFGELASPHFALFGRSALSKKPAPLSSLFGLKTLSGKAGPSWTSSFGLPLLTSGTAQSFGLPLLSRNPAPLSSLFGLRVLSRYQ
jgi:hypothetical protein